MSSNQKTNTYRLTGLAILTALIIVLQVFTTFVKFGPFSITLALIPMVIGTAMYGVGAGAYLGAVLGVIVTIMCMTGGDPGGAMVWAANPFMCAVMCIFKTAAAGLCAGLVYKALCSKNKYLAVLFAAIVSPIVNTGIFIGGMLIFFRDLLNVWRLDWAASQTGDVGMLTYIIIGVVGVNFLVEFAVNIALTPVALKAIEAVKKSVR